MKHHGPLTIDVFIEPMFQENGYLLGTQEGAGAWIVDPGFPPQHEEIIAALKKRKLTPAAILITHGHTDHIAGVVGLRAAYPELPIHAPRDEQHMLTDARANLSAQIGMNLVVPACDRPVSPGETLTLGQFAWQVLDVAGHSPGGVAYYCPEAGVVFTGDSLFAGSIGRTDFPGSSTTQLLDNIRRHLLTLPDDTVVYSGHGPATTIAHERETNPFLKEGY